MTDIFVILWLGFMLLGYAMSLFFQGGPAPGAAVDLLLPIYAVMITGVALTLLRPPSREAGTAADRGGSPHA